MKGTKNETKPLITQHWVQTRQFQNAWVVCQFAKDPSAEHLLAVGDENGFIHFLDAREDTITNCKFIYLVIDIPGKIVVPVLLMSVGEKN